MNRSFILKMVILGLWLLIACLLYAHYSQDNKKAVPIPDKIEDGTISRKFDVSKIVVLSGSTFEITLKNDVKFLGKFLFATSSDTKNVMINLFNHSTKPEVFIHKKQPDGYWSVDIYVNKDGEQIDVSEYLKTQKLIYR